MERRQVIENGIIQSETPLAFSLTTAHRGLISVARPGRVTVWSNPQLTQ
jgi:hypothetical protein